MANNLNNRMAKFEEWWDLTPSERVIAKMPVSLEEFAKKNLINLKRAKEWDAHLKATRARKDDDFREFRAHLKVIAFLPDASPQDRRTYAQVNGWLNEQKEENKQYEFTSQDRLRIATETIAGLRESYERDGGVCPVCGKPSLLFDKLCLDTEQDHGEKGKVGAVAVPA